MAVKVINMQEDESTEIFREFRKEALLMRYICFLVSRCYIYLHLLK